MNEYFTSISQASTSLYYPPFKKRNHGQYYLYQPHRYVTAAEPEVVETSPPTPQGTQINDLYPEILAIVFSFLPLQDKGRACQVCRKWYNTIYQYKSLWKNIEAKVHLSNIHYSNKVVMKNIIKSIVKRNITRIQILSTSNNNINLLFKNNYMIRSLNLSGLYNLNDNIILNLIIVNLNLNKFNQLSHLNLSVCKLITDTSIMYISKFMNRLIDLNVSGCNGITNNSLLFIYKYLSELKRLNLKSLWLINDVGINYLCGVGVDIEEADDFTLPKRTKPTSSHYLNELINRIDERYSSAMNESRPSESSEESLNTPVPVKTLPRKYLTSTLETLILQDCQRITDESIKVIAANMTSLRHLNLSFCINVSDNCFKYINKMPKLNELIMTSCNITDTGIEYLNSNLDNLHTLDLCFCESITDRTLQHLSVYILNLKHLYLSHCLITDAGLSRMSKTMFNLEKLYLGQCHSITDASIIQLIQSTSDELDRCSSSESRSNPRVDSRPSSQPDPERKLKYLDVYGCKLINYNVLLTALSQSNSNIVINFGLS